MKKIVEIKMKRIEESRSDQSQSQLTAPKGRQLTAQCEALCSNAITNPIAPRINVVKGDRVLWGKIANMRLVDKLDKGNIQYSINNNQCRSWEREDSRSFPTYGTSVGRQSQLIVLKGRQAIARGNALGLNERIIPIVPRSAIVQGNEFTWGKTNHENKENVEYRITNNEYRSWEKKESRSDQSQLKYGCRGFQTAIINVRNGIRTTRSEEKNRSLFATDLSLKRHAELVSASLFTNTVAFGVRFLSAFGMTITYKTTRLAQYTIIMEFFSFSPPWESLSRYCGRLGEAHKNIA